MRVVILWVDVIGSVVILRFVDIGSVGILCVVYTGAIYYWWGKYRVSGNIGGR